MCAFPFLKVCLFLFCLVLAVCDDVKELHCGHHPHIIPGATASLTNEVYIGNPTPSVSKRIICLRISATIVSLLS